MNTEKETKKVTLYRHWFYFGNYSKLQMYETTMPWEEFNETEKGEHVKTTILDEVDPSHRLYK